MKRWKHLALLLLAAVCMMGTAHAASEVVASGDCGGEGDGTNLTWTLTADGTLTISGSGAMADYRYQDAPWYGLEVKQLVLNKGITAIGKYAFSNCSGLTGSLSIPESVESIGDRVFSDCEGFTGSLSIPEGVKSIGNYAFYGCSGFTDSLFLPEGLESIGNYAFWGCSGLTGSLLIPESVESIGDRAFSGCEGFTGNLLIPEGLESIGNGVFAYCPGLTGSLSIPEGVKSIGNSAFYGCSGFTGSLLIPEGVESIGDRAFYDCRGLAGNLFIPEGVVNIGSDAFFNCTGLAGILSIPSTVQTIGEWAFHNRYSDIPFLGPVLFAGDMPTDMTDAFHEDEILYYKSGAKGWDDSAYTAVPYTSEEKTGTIIIDLAEDSVQIMEGLDGKTTYFRPETGRLIYGTSKCLIRQNNSGSTTTSHTIAASTDCSITLSDINVETAKNPVCIGDGASIKLTLIGKNKFHIPQKGSSNASGIYVRDASLTIDGTGSLSVSTDFSSSIGLNSASLIIDGGEFFLENGISTYGSDLAIRNSCCQISINGGNIAISGSIGNSSKNSIIKIAGGNISIHPRTKYYDRTGIYGGDIYFRRQYFH